MDTKEVPMPLVAGGVAAAVALIAFLGWFFVGRGDRLQPPQQGVAAGRGAAVDEERAQQRVAGSGNGGADRAPSQRRVR